MISWAEASSKDNQVKEEIYGEALTTKDVDLSDGTGLGGSSAKRCGKMVMLYVSLVFAAGENQDSTSHRLPEGVRPALAVDATDTFTDNNWPSGIRFLIRQNGVICPTGSTGLARNKTIRASVTYLLP